MLLQAGGTTLLQTGECTYAARLLKGHAEASSLFQVLGSPVKQQPCQSGNWCNSDSALLVVTSGGDCYRPI
jgi:hypothetical protein